MKARAQTPEYKARMMVYRQTPQYKAYQKAYHAIYAKAYRKANRVRSEPDSGPAPFLFFQAPEPPPDTPAE